MVENDLFGREDVFVWLDIADLSLVENELHFESIAGVECFDHLLDEKFFLL